MVCSCRQLPINPKSFTLEGSTAQIGELSMVPGSTPIVHTLPLKSKSAFAKQINKANEVRARRFH
jgi:hypothetical protein